MRSGSNWLNLLRAEWDSDGITLYNIVCSQPLTLIDGININCHVEGLSAFVFFKEKNRSGKALSVTERKLLLVLLLVHAAFVE